MGELIAARRQSMKCIFPKDDKEDKIKDDADRDDDVEAKLQKLSVEQNSEFVRQIQAMVSAATTTDGYLNSRRTPMEIRLCNVNYQVQLEESDHPNISTIYNSSPLYKIQKLIQSALLSSGERKKNDEVEWTNVLSNVNLVLQPKKMYLVLGPPLSGKTSLLKAIAGMLSSSAKKKKDGSRLSGSIRYNNLNVLGGDGEKHNKALLQNLVAFVRQSDDHAPRLTVDETFRFATNCKDPNHKPPPSAAASGEGSEKISGRVESTLEALGLPYVKDTFVGDENVRGVSGGQRRRVTLGEVSYNMCPDGNVS
jgi:energy-coupling factor transporter ATP-binding protein EcfA2